MKPTKRLYTNVVGAEAKEAFIAEQRKRIPSYDVLTRRQAENMLVLLAHHFKTAPAQLRWRNVTERGHAFGHHNLISTGPNTWRGVTNCLLHEYSHLLTHVREPKAKAHGIEFQKVLWEVVMVWHGDPDLYDWSFEYDGVKAYGLRTMLIYQEELAKKIEHAEREAAGPQEPKGNVYAPVIL